MSTPDPAALKLTTYDSTGSDRTSLSAWKVMVGELFDSRELIQRLVVRNIAGQFRQSFLGYVWVALPPVAMTLVFTVLRRAGVVNVPMEEGAMPYALFALVGTTMWGTFSQTVSMATMSISNAGMLVSKVYFPRETLVISAVGNSLVNMVIRIVVLAISFAAFLYAPHLQILYGVLILVPLFALALGLGFFFAPINTMMHDMGRVLEFIFQFGMFLAPTIYPTPALAGAETSWQVILFWLHKLNPVSHFLYAFHSLIETGTFPAGPGLFTATVVSFLVLLMGWRFFHICEPFLAERL